MRSQSLQVTNLTIHPFGVDGPASAAAMTVINATANCANCADETGFEGEPPATVAGRHLEPALPVLPPFLPAPPDLVRAQPHA